MFSKKRKKGWTYASVTPKASQNRPAPYGRTLSGLPKKSPY